MPRRIQAEFDDGILEIELNGDPERVVRFNANDLNFIDRFLKFSEAVETDFRARAERIAAKLENGEGEWFDRYNAGDFEKLGQEFNAALDKVFGCPVSGTAFMGVNPLSPVANGRLLFENFLNALAPVIEECAGKFTESRQKYTEAFREKARK